MAITNEDRLRDSGHFDITPEQEREQEAREECERLGIDPDEECADGGVLAWMVVDKDMRAAPAKTDDWFSRVVSFFVEHGMLDQRDEYAIDDVMAALRDNYAPASLPTPA